MAKKQYYELRDTINKYPDAQYYVIFGERSNGKSYSFLSYATEFFYKSGCLDAFGYIRRWSEDVKMAQMEQVFKSLVCNDKGKNEIERVTDGNYNDVLYKTKKFYLVHRDADGEIDKKCDNPLGYVFNLSESERIKSTGYPDIKNIVLEEFISENLNLVNEFTRFTSIISTIVRNKAQAKIFLLGNTVNRHNIYFKEMGLTRANKMAKNSIDTYRYNDDNGDELLIVCEYCDFPDKTIKKSNVYFAFNKEKNKMIRSGQWAIGNYPHLSNYYKPKDIKLIYFIIFENQIYQCEIIRVLDDKDSKILISSTDKPSNKYVEFTFIHLKTTPIKYPHEHIIYQQDYSPYQNVRRSINRPYDKIGNIIYSYYATDKVQFQDNEVGDNIRAYLEWCRQYA